MQTNYWIFCLSLPFNVMDIEEIIIKMFAQFIKFLLGFLTVYFGLESFGI
jgi:hypothetical protein